MCGRRISLYSNVDNNEISITYMPPKHADMNFIIEAWEMGNSKRKIQINPKVRLLLGKTKPQNGEYEITESKMSETKNTVSE